MLAHMYKSVLPFAVLFSTASGCFAQFPKLPSLPIPAPSSPGSRTAVSGSTNPHVGGSSVMKGVNDYRLYIEALVRNNADTASRLLATRTAYLDSLRPAFVQDIGSSMIRGAASAGIAGESLDPAEVRALLGSDFATYRAAYIRIQQLKKTVALRSALGAGWTSSPELTNFLFTTQQTGVSGRRQANGGETVADGGYLELVHGGRLLTGLTDFLVDRESGQLIATSPAYLAASEMAFLNDMLGLLHSLDYLRLHLQSARFEKTQMPQVRMAILRDDAERISGDYAASTSRDQALLDTQKAGQTRQYSACWTVPGSTCSSYQTYGCMAVFRASGDRLGSQMGIQSDDFMAVQNKCVDVGAGDFADLGDRSTLQADIASSLRLVQSEGQRIISSESAYLAKLESRTVEQKAEFAKLQDQVADLVIRSKQKQGQLELEALRQTANQEAKAAEAQRQAADLEAQVRAEKEKLQSQRTCQTGMSNARAAAQYSGDDIVKDAVRQITEKCKALAAAPLSPALREEVSGQIARLEKRVERLRAH
jgi:hypothetical protein